MPARIDPDWVRENTNWDPNDSRRLREMRKALLLLVVCVALLVVAGLTIGDDLLVGGVVGVTACLAGAQAATHAWDAVR